MLSEKNKWMTEEPQNPFHSCCAWRHGDARSSVSVRYRRSGAPMTAQYSLGLSYLRRKTAVPDMSPEALCEAHRFREHSSCPYNHMTLTWQH